MVIEHKGKRYVVIGGNDTYYLVTEPWMEDIGPSYSIKKSEAIIIKE